MALIREIKGILILRRENFQCHSARAALSITIRAQGKVKLTGV